jgi:hypothetical protein
MEAMALIEIDGLPNFTYQKWIFPWLCNLNNQRVHVLPSRKAMYKPLNPTSKSDDGSEKKPKKWPDRAGARRKVAGFFWAGLAGEKWGVTLWESNLAMKKNYFP